MNRIDMEKIINYHIVKDNIDCKGINIVDLVKHILNKKCEIVNTDKKENGHFIATADFWDDMRNSQVKMNLVLEYDEMTIYEVKLGVYKQENDLNDYTMDTKLYYYENLDIYKSIQEIRAENYNPKTVRIYKLMYNSYPIEGTYSFNLKNCNLIFHTINIIERGEPLTEHIVAFDVKIKTINIQEARAIAYNIVADFTSYLSVLLDVSFYEPQSIYRNFVRLSRNQSYQRIISHERFRTSFIDKELNLVIKNNMNGLTTVDDVKKGENFDSGYISMELSNNNNVSWIVPYGNTKNVEEVFEKHRLEKVPRSQPKYSKEIMEDLFVPGQKILIPKCIREYFREIDNLENKKKRYFRNSARLYNMSKFMEVNGASLQIALLVASVESLAKAEGLNYSEFVKEYCQFANKSDIDEMYEMRSKLFHSGEFSFFEFDISMNPYLNPVFEHFSEKYTKYRRIIRKSIITWITRNVLNQKDGSKE
ncbi:MAG TPA: hypothetical protein IAC14_14705 [Candidatus Scybalomonas excrementigallinarum]|nr:hypothetical protein [Candidatus Scybalomonas excrementigallinarum]